MLLREYIHGTTSVKEAVSTRVLLMSHSRLASSERQLLVVSFGIVLKKDVTENNTTKDKTLAAVTMPRKVFDPMSP